MRPLCLNHKEYKKPNGPEQCTHCRIDSQIKPVWAYETRMPTIANDDLEISCANTTCIEKGTMPSAWSSRNAILNYKSN